MITGRNSSNGFVLCLLYGNATALPGGYADSIHTLALNFAVAHCFFDSSPDFKSIICFKYNISTYVNNVLNISTPSSETDTEYLFALNM